jgi:hypothetical protein
MVYGIDFKNSNEEKFVTENPTKLVRNPNTPEGIQARLNNLPNPTEFKEHAAIIDKDASLIVIDLTKQTTSQRIGDSFFQNRDVDAKRLVRVVVSRNPDGTSLMISYYFDSVNSKWTIIKGNYTFPPRQEHNYSINPAPRSTYPGSWGYGSGIPGENWINEGISVKKIQQNQDRIFKEVPIDPKANNIAEQPEDYYKDEI